MSEKIYSFNTNLQDDPVSSCYYSRSHGKLIPFGNVPFFLDKIKVDRDYGIFCTIPSGTRVLCCFVKAARHILCARVHVLYMCVCLCMYISICV